MLNDTGEINCTGRRTARRSLSECYQEGVGPEWRHHGLIEVDYILDCFGKEISGP